MLGEQYAIGLALLVEGKVVLAVMACPKLPLASTAVTNNTHKSSPEKMGCLFFGSVGSGTYVQSLNVVDSSPVKKLGIKESPIKINSQTKYAALSRGDGEVYLRFTRKPRPESIWNHAAGSILVSEAGGKVTDAAGNPLDFSKGKYLDYKRGIVVTTQKLLPRLLKALPLASTAVTNNTHKSSPEKMGCLFFGSVGSGTYVQSLNVVDSSPVKKLGIKESPIKINSQTKYAALSRGDGEVYLRFTRKPRPESIWNHAAGSILVSEAGGKVTDAEGNPLDFSKGKYLDYKRGIVVTTQKLIAKAFESGKRIH
ncbi:hypothetical protein Bca52824_055704 [Brassica carinata]|uniref:3'(2'),5'-bisphosphate nucleotidase n=1 Tax=Brassica carinata TaxID=52824 RepID=A0A8X7RFS6_BRACI|nr:hypothetical protein Bca52824_055704 [Brassica carinata]